MIAARPTSDTAPAVIMIACLSSRPVVSDAALSRQGIDVPAQAG